MKENNQEKNKKELMLLLSRCKNPLKDFAVATLSWMCKAKGMEFDVYYSSNQEGQIFSTYGSSLVGGRHDYVISKALARFDTQVIKLGEINVFDHMIYSSAKRVLEYQNNIVELYQRLSDEFGIKFTTVVAVQTKDLPKVLDRGVEMYTYPEVVYRKAAAVPLEISDEDIERLKSLGLDEVLIISTADANTDKWTKGGFNRKRIHLIKEDDTYLSLTFGFAEPWLETADAIDICPPVNASYWLPFAVAKNRIIVFGEIKQETVDRLVPLIENKDQRTVYGRYAGEGTLATVNNALGDDTGDIALFGLYKKNIAFQVTEPGRPVLSVFSRNPDMLAQPEKSTYEYEPSDETLSDWADAGKILTTLLYYSGELSHDDAMINAMAISSITGVKAGISVHYQRYLYDPHSVEALNIPREDGGVLGLCEPVLHSSGYGIMSEVLGNPKKTAAMMKEARDRIADIAGERFAPRGVYCYLDAIPGKWDVKPTELWKAIADVGFEYVISNVASGENNVLYKDDNFLVLNLWYNNVYPSSPFIRTGKVGQIQEMEWKISAASRPGWIIGVIDSPVYVYSGLLLTGKSARSCGNASFESERIGRFYDYIKDHGDTTKIISATPHTIARYANILYKKRFIDGV